MLTVTQQEISVLFFNLIGSVYARKPQSINFTVVPALALSWPIFLFRE